MRLQLSDTTGAGALLFAILLCAPLARAETPASEAMSRDSAESSESTDADGSTQITSDALVYSDTDSVLVFSPQVTARQELDDDGGEVSARVVVDAITAASVDVISNATYRFSEIRTQADLAVARRVAGFLPSVGYRYSYEPDYQSNGVRVGAARRLAGADTVLGGSYGVTFDRIGRADTPRETFSRSLTSHAAEVSLTQVIDTRSLIRLVYSLTAQFGYMEKPYRSVPLFDQAGLDAAQAAGVELDLATYDNFRLATKPPEEVPDDRIRHAVAVRYLRYLPSVQASLRLDYRFYGDSWGMFAHTGELGVRRAITRCCLVHLWNRLHVQSSVSFWQRAYVVSDPLSIPALRTVDRSLSRSVHNTLGGRGEWARGALRAYLELAGMYSNFGDFLLLTHRFAVLTQAGVRWRF